VNLTPPHISYMMCMYTYPHTCTVTGHISAVCTDTPKLALN